MLLAAFPRILGIFAEIMGIASPMNTLFFFGFCFAVLLIFSLSVTVSKQADKIRKLSQEIAILRKDSYDSKMELKKKIEEQSHDR